MTSWRELISLSMKHVSDSWDNASTLAYNSEPGDLYSDDDNQVIGRAWDHPEAAKILDKQFDDDYGDCQGHSFILYTENHIYASGEYDGAEYVIRLPRHPAALSKVNQLEHH